MHSFTNPSLKNSLYLHSLTEGRELFIILFEYHERLCIAATTTPFMCQTYFITENIIIMLYDTHKI